MDNETKTSRKNLQGKGGLFPATSFFLLAGAWVGFLVQEQEAMP